MLRKLLLELVLGATFLVLLTLGVKSYFNLKEQYKDLKEASVIEKESHLKYKKVNDSIIAAYVTTQQVTLETAKTLFKEDLDAYKAQTGGKLSNLESLLKTQVKGQNTYVFNNIDTAYCDSLYLSQKDKFNEIDILVKDGTAVVNTKNYTYLTKYTYKTRKRAAWYKPWLWGKELRTEIKSDNPKDSIINIKEIIIK